MSETNETPCCKNCIYFKQSDRGESICRRNPPVVLVTSMMLPRNYGEHNLRPDTVWPIVFGSYWCGEYLLKVKEKVDTDETEPV